MEYGVKHQIERYIEKSKSNAESLEKILDIYDKLDHSVWDPRIYHRAVKELERVMMCVIPRSTLLDMLTLINQVEEDLSDDVCFVNKYEAEISKDEALRIKKSIESSLKGIPTFNGE